MHRVCLLGLLLVACTSSSPQNERDASSDCTTDDDCSDGVFCNGAEICADGACEPGSLPCEGAQSCDEPNATCATQCDVVNDADGDGAIAVECGGNDCDDSNPARFPGNTEVCDPGGFDEDCDPSTFGYRDQDMDGYPDAACCNTIEGFEPSCGRDCDDTLPGANPANPEVCNGVDDDCDGDVDEDVRLLYTVDADRDGHGDESAGAATMMGCEPPDGYARLADDCDDGDADRFPGNPETCDLAMKDEDCSGAGNDVDGGCACLTGEQRPCGDAGRCLARQQRCENEVWEACPADGVPGTELCDPATVATAAAIDEDCDGSTDEGLLATCWADGDGDGWAAASATEETLCAVPERAGAPFNGCPAGYTGRSPASAADCCDSDSRANPGQSAGQITARTTCGGFDFDCDGAETPTVAGTVVDCTSLSQGSCTADRRGWSMSAPACGDSAGYVNGCRWDTRGGCRRSSFTTAIMPCR